MVNKIIKAQSPLLGPQFLITQFSCGFAALGPSVVNTFSFSRRGRPQRPEKVCYLQQVFVLEFSGCRSDERIFPSPENNWPYANTERVQL